MRSTLCGMLLAMAWPSMVFSQSVTIEVWTYTSPGVPQAPSNQASVRIYPASNIPTNTNVPVQRPTPTGPNQNQYVLDGASVGSLVDITVRQENHHVWTVRDLYVGGGDPQKLSVQLFRYDYPIKAPQCFALKTQYELLFREEQRLAPRVDRKEIQHRVRLKYADGVLALPNPSRQHVQSEEIRQMLKEMKYEDRDELNDMVNGLFKLYEMDGFVRFAPSIWNSQYQTPGGQMVDSEVRIQGNRGTYMVNGVAHQLEGIDIFTEENSDGGSTDIITGQWRFTQGGQASGGDFRWKVDGENHFDGVYHFEGRDQSLTWSGDRVEMVRPAE